MWGEVRDKITLRCWVSAVMKPTVEDIIASSWVSFLIVLFLQKDVECKRMAVTC